MLKTDEHLLPLSTKQQYTHDQYQKKNKAKQRKIENAIMFGSMNPLYGAAASTVASSQGSTYRSEVLLNMNKIGGGDQLVGMTRPTNLKNVIVSGVSTGARKRKLQSDDMYTQKRLHMQNKHPYYKFR